MVNIEFDFYNHSFSRSTFSNGNRFLFRITLTDNVVFKRSLIIDGKLSGIQIPEDLILSQSNDIQILYQSVSVASNVDITGILLIEDRLNQISVPKMCELFDQSSNTWSNLTIEGTTCVHQF